MSQPKILNTKILLGKGVLHNKQKFKYKFCKIGIELCTLVIFGKILRLRDQNERFSFLSEFFEYSMFWDITTELIILLENVILRLFALQYCLGPRADLNKARSGKCHTSSGPFFLSAPCIFLLIY